jgi:NADH-quinone oxidoreductase subunit H
MKILYVLLGLFIIFNYGLLKTGLIRRITARVGKRIGVPIYQPYIDLIKTYGIRSQVIHGNMFYLGPVFRLAGGVGIFLFMPLIYGSEMFSNFSFAGDLILILYFIFFGMLGMALGAGEGGHPYSIVGISRGLSQFTTVKIPLTLAVISIAVQYQSLSISEIVAAQQGGITNWTLFTNPLATVAAFFSFLGMMMYSPFNVVNAPQENPIGPPTEYQGPFHGMLQTNRAILGVMESILFVNLFYGGATGWIELIVKSFIVYFPAVFIGVVFPRFRVEQSIRWFILFPTILGVLAILFIS